MIVSHVCPKNLALQKKKNAINQCSNEGSGDKPVGLSEFDPKQF